MACESEDIIQVVIFGDVRLCYMAIHRLIQPH
jgi:hypothetical protein